MKQLTRLVLCGAFVACVDSSVDDATSKLTGTEETAVTMANGQPACTNPNKQLVCHIPPGNPSNAHEICVSLQAVEAHVLGHGDLAGACVPPGPNGDPPPPPGDAGPDDDPPPPPGDAGPDDDPPPCDAGPDAGHDHAYE